MNRADGMSHKQVHTMRWLHEGHARQEAKHVPQITANALMGRGLIEPSQASLTHYRLTRQGLEWIKRN